MWDVLFHKLYLRGLGLSFGLPRWQSGIESACNAGDEGSIPGSGRSPEDGMATHSSVLARRTPGTEERGRLQPIGSQRVRDLVCMNTRDGDSHLHKKYVLL